jgi:hypothetical protein
MSAGPSTRSTQQGDALGRMFSTYIVEVDRPIATFTRS